MRLGFFPKKEYTNAELSAYVKAKALQLNQPALHLARRRVSSCAHV